MTAPTPPEADVLNQVIRSVTDLWDEPLDEVQDLPQIVNAVLAAGYRLAPEPTDQTRKACTPSPDCLCRDECEFAPAPAADQTREQIEQIRARWSNGPTGRYPEATEAADQRDVEYLLALVDRLAVHVSPETVEKTWPCDFPYPHPPHVAESSDDMGQLIGYTEHCHGGLGTSPGPVVVVD